MAENNVFGTCPDCGLFLDPVGDGSFEVECKGCNVSFIDFNNKPMRVNERRMLSQEPTPLEF